MEKLPFNLSKELEGKYEVINTKLPVLHSRIGKVDFRTMKADQAEALLAAGTRYLKKVRSSKKRNSS